MTAPIKWRVSGSYYEVCNCDAICPCRRQGGRPAGRFTYDTCDFALSWLVREGAADAIELSGLRIVLAGRWDDARPPWHVILYVDERANGAQQGALADIFLGRAGGTAFKNYGRAIGEVYAVKPAGIELDHSRNGERIKVASYISASTARPVSTGERITCAIPGHDRPGQEIVAGKVRVADAPLDFEWEGRCGFASDFDYRSDA